jgi:biopolymer transport protein ExbD
MRGRARREAEEAEVNITPMLDIVFILLIFFIVTAVFVQERAINLTPPPPSDTDQPQDPQPTIRIRIDEDNLIEVNGRRADIGTVRANIERLRAENPNRAVLVQAHPDAKSGLVVRVVDKARSANVANVGFVLDQVE